MPSAAPHPDTVITGPFDEARWATAVAWPFRHWQVSRYSDGSFGVWYGADTFETAVCESAWHWQQGLLADAGFVHEHVVSERAVYTVACHALLLDFTPPEAPTCGTPPATTSRSRWAPACTTRATPAC